MKNMFLALILEALTLPVWGYNYNQYKDSSSGQTNKVEKVYSTYGSLQGYYKSQPNGTVKAYSKFGQYQGYFYTSGSKVKYKSR